jgi:hypothetical protein
MSGVRGKAFDRDLGKVDPFKFTTQSIAIPRFKTPHDTKLHESLPYRESILLAVGKFLSQTLPLNSQFAKMFAKEHLIT